MQYTEMIFSCKNEDFIRKNLDIFLIFAQNIDCGYKLEYPQSMFWNKKDIRWTCYPDVFSFQWDV